MPAVRSLLHLIWLLAIACLASPASAEDISILLSARDGVYREASDAIAAETGRDGNARLTIGTVGTHAVADLLQGNPVLLIAVGTRAAELALRPGQVRVPVLALLVPRNTFLNIVGRLDTLEQRRTAAIYLDQPFGRQLELIRHALPNLTHLGTVLGPETDRELEAFQSQAASRGMVLVAGRASAETELFPALQRIMSETEAFVAIPDARVINADTAQNLLLTSFSFRMPVIAYSAAYVRAGALAAVYSTAQQAGREAGEAARAMLRGAPLPAARYPRYFSVGINRHMAVTLGLSLPDESTLRERIQRGEQE